MEYQKIAKFSKNPPQNENDKEIPKERCISAEERQKTIINLLDNTQNQPTKFRTKNWVEINNDLRRKYKTNSQINFKPLMLRSSLCDNGDAQILVSGTTTITGAGVDDAAKQLDERNKRLIFKNYALFTHCISEINNTQIDNAKYTDVVMPLYNLIEYSDNYSKTS